MADIRNLGQFIVSYFLFGVMSRSAVRWTLLNQTLEMELFFILFLLGGIFGEYYK